MNILQLLASSSYITLNKHLIKMFGLEEATIIGIFASTHNYNELICEKKGIEFDGWFYKTYEDIEEELGLSKHIASKAIDRLIKNKILIDKKKGVPCLRYFKFQEVEFFNSLKLKNLTSSNKKNEFQEVKRFNNLSETSLITSSKNTLLQEGEIFNCNNNTNKKTYNILSKTEDDEWKLFFLSFWENYNPTCDWNNNYGLKGSKSKAEKLFKDLVLKGESPVYIIWGAKAYLNKISGSRQNVHAEVFLRNKMWEEFVEEEVKRIEAESKQKNQIAKDQKELEFINNDPFWINAKEELLKLLPENWAKSFKDFQYLGLRDGFYIINATSKFTRDWFKREYKQYFDKIFNNWNLIYYDK